MNDMTTRPLQWTLRPQNELEAQCLRKQAEAMRASGYNIEVPEMAEPLGLWAPKPASPEHYAVEASPLYLSPMEVPVSLERPNKAEEAKSSTEPKKRDIPPEGETASGYVSFWGQLLNDVQKLAEAVRDAVIGNRDFALALGSVFAKASIVLPVPPAFGDLPSTAPRLWEKRDKNKEKNPADFILSVYSAWLPGGISRQEIGNLDDALGKAYSQWIRPERHPEDVIDFAPRRSGLIKDPQEAIDRRRATDRESKARLRKQARVEKLRHQLSPI